jgi:hypothetical protein
MPTKQKRSTKKTPQKKLGEIIFEYKISPNYSVYNVNGAYGGPNGFGNIIANFWSERGPIAKTHVFQVDKDGNIISDSLEQNLQESMTRDVLFAISLTPSVARSMGEWLIRHADNLIKMTDQPKGGSENNE